MAVSYLMILLIEEKNTVDKSRLVRTLGDKSDHSSRKWGADHFCHCRFFVIL
jgi:hypothetical protein